MSNVSARIDVIVLAYANANATGDVAHIVRVKWKDRKASMNGLGAVWTTERIANWGQVRRSVSNARAHIDAIVFAYVHANAIGDVACVVRVKWKDRKVSMNGVGTVWTTEIIAIGW
jgi:hypothetical protein